jgi:hypothetical protein
MASIAAVKISVEEILAMPAANRAAIAQSQAQPKLYSELIDIAFDKKQNYQKRWSALTLASQVGGPKAVGDLEKALQASEWFMRNAALLSLQQISEAKAKSWAVKLLKDESLVVRSAAVLALPDQLSPLEREVLWQELTSKYNFRGQQSLWIRAQLLEGLAKAPQKNEMILFSKYLADKDNRLVLPAMAALEKISPQAEISVAQPMNQRKKAWQSWVRHQGIAIQ